MLVVINKFEFEKRRRTPAYTDRILHHVTPDAYENVRLSVVQTEYMAHPQYTNSDHKPVTATFVIKVRGSNISVINIIMTILV